MVEFEWDDAKAETNLRKHGISFDDAARAFGDFHALELNTEISAEGEIRRKLVAISQKRFVVVDYTERGDWIRIISARKATKYERNTYSENNQ